VGLAQVIVDASAVLAILLEEPDGPTIEDVLLEGTVRHVISPINYLEAAVRADSRPEAAKGRELDLLLSALRIDITNVTSEQAYFAREAYRKFGRGNHPAKLNLGDCFAYALSKARSEPLLFKGDDFRKTDVEAAA
jgi:ribonuclease VapC